MKENKILNNSQIIILGVCIAIATIAASFILSRAALKIMQLTQEQITVTGSASKKIVSDFIVWQSSFSCRASDLKTAYNQMKIDLDKIKTYLKSKNVSDSEISVSPVSIETIYKKNDKGGNTNEIEGYQLTQSIEVSSGNVTLINNISQDATELIEQDVAFLSQQPSYHYTRIDELKIEMLAKATENAKQRAASMVQATGNRIGLMRSARMGVFQITPVLSTDISDWGINDTSTLEKKVMAVVSVKFAID